LETRCGCAESTSEPCTAIQHERRSPELSALLHRREHVADAQQQLRGLLRALIAEGAEAGDLRNDVPPEELACYCLYALTGAGSLPSKSAVGRLVTVTIAGLRPAR